MTRRRPARKTMHARRRRLRLGYLDRHLDGREFLLDRFSVADAYLVTVLNWSQASGIDLSEWPNRAGLLQAHDEAPERRPCVSGRTRALCGGNGPAESCVTTLDQPSPRGRGCRQRRRVRGCRVRE